MKKKNLIYLLFISLAFNIYGEELPNKEVENKKKNNFITLRRNSSILYPTEYDMYASLFRNSIFDNINNFNYNSFGYQRFFENTKFSLEINSFENKKSNMQYDSLIFSNNGVPSSTKDNVGTYFRSENNLLVHYHFIENRVSSFFGVQDIRSNLSDSISNFRNYNFEQNFKGLAVGINFETPRFYGLFLNLGIKYSFLRGNLDYNLSQVNNARQVNVSILKDNVLARYNMTEYKLALCYELNDSLSFSLGTTHQHVNITENQSNLQGYTPEATVLLRTLFNNYVSTESFKTVYASITGKF